MLFFKKIVFLIIVFTFFNVSAQNQETIIWKPGVKLSWSNFKGKAPVGNRAAAMTASGVNYKYTTYFDKKNGNKFTYEVIAIFYPRKSWYRPKICTDITLSHEQIHFDIAELYARKMREKLSKVVPSSNTYKQARAIYTSVNKELDAYQDLYDKETNYSRDLEKQLFWQEKVKKELQLK